MSLEIDPSEGVFNVSGERKTFTIINVTKGRLAFKVKTSDVDLYRAKPVYGFVVPQEKIKLIIQRMEG
uniref:MSP domain-containing protein n=1 Tax=Acrobeloides nanus TaxID=290746 RepID=A0A914DIL3_9BILA